MAPAKIDPKAPENQEKRNGDSPERKSNPRAGKFKISIYDAWCKQCNLCVDFCPKGVLAKRPIGSPLVDVPDQCIGCKLCVLHCPDFAISIAAKEDAAEKAEG